MSVFNLSVTRTCRSVSLKITGPPSNALSKDGRPLRNAVNFSGVRSRVANATRLFGSLPPNTKVSERSVIVIGIAVGLSRQQVQNM